MIENIICGADKDWSDSVDQLPLDPVRDGARSAYQIACRTARRVVCTPPLQSLDEHDTNSSESH